MKKEKEKLSIIVIITFSCKHFYKMYPMFVENNKNIVTTITLKNDTHC